MPSTYRITQDALAGLRALIAAPVRSLSPVFTLSAAGSGQDPAPVVRLTRRFV